MLFSFWSGLDGRARFPYVSPRFVKLFRVDPEELAVDATPYFQLTNPEDVPEILRSVEASRQELSLWRQQWRATAPELGEIWLEAHSMPVREPDGTTTWHGTVSDVTERRHIDEQLRELNTNLERRVAQRTAELEASNRELEAFSYSVSHDLREPLRAINGFSQALLEDFGPTLPAQAQHFLDNVRQGALRMGRLIDDLLAFSRLSRQPLERRRLDMRRLVEDCVKRLAAEYPRTSVTLGALPGCNADPGLIEQVIMNLLANAFKYSHNDAHGQCLAAGSRDLRGHGPGLAVDERKSLRRSRQRDREVRGRIEARPHRRVGPHPSHPGRGPHRTRLADAVGRRRGHPHLGHGEAHGRPRQGGTSGRIPVVDLSGHQGWWRAPLPPCERRDTGAHRHHEVPERRGRSQLSPEVGMR